MLRTLDAARLTIITIAAGSANLIAIVSTATGLAQQLDQTHNFLHMDLPIWIFFIGAFILSIMGTMLAWLIDLMSIPPPTKVQLLINLVLGFMTGILGAFILLPIFTEKPTMPLLLLTSLCMSFLGAVLVRNVGELLHSAELWLAVKNMLKNFIIERIELLLALFGGGRKK